MGKRQSKSPPQSLVVVAAEEEDDPVVTGRLERVEQSSSSSSLPHEALAVVTVDFVRGGFVVERHSSESHIALLVGVAVDSDLSLVVLETLSLVVAVATFVVDSGVVELDLCGCNRLENQLSTAF